MNGPQHYQEAERLLAAIQDLDGAAMVTSVAAEAQVHATLALVAAEAERFVAAYAADGTGREWHAARNTTAAWREVGTLPPLPTDGDDE